MKIVKVLAEKIAVIGGREFTDYDLLSEILCKEEPCIIISGGANGADKLARRYADQHNIEIIEYIPEYNKYGRGAPIVRNKIIVEQSDKIIAFWNGQSKGTANVIKLGERIGKDVRVIRY